MMIERTKTWLVKMYLHPVATLGWTTGPAFNKTTKKVNNVDNCALATEKSTPPLSTWLTYKASMDPGKQDKKEKRSLLCRVGSLQ